MSECTYHLSNCMYEYFAGMKFSLGHFFKGEGRAGEELNSLMRMRGLLWKIDRNFCLFASIRLPCRSSICVPVCIYIYIYIYMYTFTISALDHFSHTLYMQVGGGMLDW